jgi:hypothetical protein
MAFRQFFIGQAKLIDDLFLFPGKDISFSLFPSLADKFRNVFHAVDNPFHLPVLAQNGRVQGTPVLFLESTVWPPHVVFLDRHGVGSLEP